MKRTKQTTEKPEEEEEEEEASNLRDGYESSGTVFATHDPSEFIVLESIQSICALVILV